MVDQVLRIGIDSTQAEAGARKVIASLKAIQQEAAKTVGAKIDVSIDTSGVTEGMAEVNKARSDIDGLSAEIPVKVDTSTVDRETADLVNRIREEVERNVGKGIPVQTSLSIVADAAVEEIGAMLAGVPDELNIPVDVLTDTVMAEINRLVSEVERSVEVDVPVKLDTAGAEADAQKLSRATEKAVPERIEIDADTSKAESAISRLTGQSRGPIIVPVSVDTARAEEQLSGFLNRAREAIEIPLSTDAGGVDVPVHVDVDEREVEAEIRRIIQQSRNATISVSADTADAQREIDRLQDNLRGAGLDGTTVRIDADASDVVREAARAEDAIRQVSDAADDLSRTGGIDLDMSRVASDSGKAAAGIDKVGSSAKKAAHDVDGLGNAFQHITQDIEFVEFLGEAILAIATSIGTAIIAFEDYEDAVKAATGSSAAAEVAMEMLEEFALSTAFSIEDVTNAFVKFRSAGLEASKEALTSYGNVAAGLNITMEELAAAVGDAAEGNFSKLNDTQLKAVESGDKVKFTYQGVTTEVQNTGKAVAAFIKTMGDTKFAGSMEDAAGGVTGAFEAMSDAWKELSRDMGEGGLSQGLQDFAISMQQASEAADELGKLLGGWLGNQLTLLGRDIEGIVDQLNDLVDIFRSVTDAINSIPSLSGVFDSQFMKNAVPALFDNGRAPPDQPEQGPPEDPAAVAQKAFGTDTNLPRKPKRTAKTEAQRQEERFARQNSENKEMIRTLVLVDEAYERGRYAVEGFRNSVEELTVRQAAQQSVGKKNAETIVEQAMAIKAYQEQIAFKGEVLDQQEAIMQTVELAEAYKQGAAAVEIAEAKQKAWNTAVQLGVSSRDDLVQQLTDLAQAAEIANDNLKLEQNLSGLDQEIESAARMATAYREGGAAVRDAALEHEVYATAVSLSKEHDEEAIARIRDKMTALRDLQEIQKSDERAMMAGFDIEQMEGELRLSQMVGEARYIEAERLDMLITKKRETKDATAELTAEEERQAEAMGRTKAAIEGQSTALEDIANSIPNIAYAFEEATGGALLHFEDALVDIITGAKSAREAFADMAKSIAADLARMAIRMAIIQPLAMMFGGMMGGGGAMVASSAVATGAPMMLGGVYHTGGIVGADTVPMRALPKFHSGGIVGADDARPAPFFGIPKFHTGGLASNETPAILQKGEGVFTAQQMQSLQPVNNNNTSAPVTINVSVQQSQGGDPAAAENQGRIIAKQVQMAMGDYISRAQKPGGQLNPNGGY